jgi:hypothetical protein
MFSACKADATVSLKSALLSSYISRATVKGKLSPFWLSASVAKK